MRSQFHTITPVHRTVLYGVLLPLVVVAAVELPSGMAFSIPALTILLAVVAFVAFVGGLWAGLISAVLVVLYGAYDLSMPGQLAHYTPENSLRLLLFGIAAFAMAIMMGSMQRRLRIAQIQLRQQLEFSTAIDQSLAEGVYALDQDGCVTYINPAAEGMLGWTQAELLGKIMHDVIHYQQPDGTPYPRDDCPGFQVLRQGVVYRSEDDMFIRKDGTMFPIAYSSSPLIRNGRVVGAVVAFRDITERKRAEEALRDSAAKLRLINGQIPAHLWTTDANLRLTSVLGSGVSQLRVNPEQCIDKTLNALVGTEDQQSPGIVAHRRALQGESAAYEQRTNEREFVCRVEPLRDEQGTVVGCLGLALDITERKRTEEALHVRARQQAAIAEFGQYAIAVANLDAVMDEAAALVVRTLGVERSKVLELLPEEDRFLIRAGVGWKAGTVGQATISAGPETHAGTSLRSSSPVVVVDTRTETRFHTPALLVEHGIVSTMSVVIHARKHPFGVLEADATHVRTFSRDDVYFLQAVANVLTAAIERKVFEDQLAQERAEAARLEELDRLRRNFVLSVSHELRTPLTTALGGLGMLELSSNGRLREDESALLTRTRHSIEYLRRLIDDLLAYNQLEAGTFRLQRAPLDLRAIVTDALPVVYDLTRGKQQMLDLDLPQPLPTAADRARLVQVVTNLLAFVHAQSPPGTLIRLAGRRSNGHLLLSVMDDRTGIAAEDVETIFQRFHRLGVAEDGAGVGLAVARAIVELHDGRLEAERFPDQGGVFRLTLPHVPVDEGEEAGGDSCSR